MASSLSGFLTGYLVLSRWGERALPSYSTCVRLDERLGGAARALKLDYIAAPFASDAAAHPFATAARNNVVITSARQAVAEGVQNLTEGVHSVVGAGSSASGTAREKTPLVPLVPSV